MKKTNIYSSLLCCVVMSSSLLGCSQPVDHTVAGGIKDALPNAIGAAKSYDVVVDSDPLEVVKGHLKKVDIIGTDVNLSPQLMIDEIDIQAEDINADVRTHQIKSVGNVTFVATIGQDSIDHYLAQQPDNSPQRQENLKVKINRNSITATVLVSALGISVPASVTGGFSVDSTYSKELNFTADNGSLSVITLPRFALKLALDRINPVIDLSNTTVPVTVNSIAIVSGKIVIHGNANLQNGLVSNT